MKTFLAVCPSVFAAESGVSCFVIASMWGFYRVLPVENNSSGKPSLYPVRPMQGGLHHLSYPRLHCPCSLLAVGIRRKGDRLAEPHLDIHPAGAEKLDNVRCKILVSDPRQRHAPGTAQRHAMAPRIGDRHRLDGYLVASAGPDRHGGGAKQRALERQDGVAIPRRALREQDHDITRLQASRNFVHLVSGTM